MIERHYDDDALAMMLEAEAWSDGHLGDCAECSGRMGSFRLVTDALRDASTWDTRELDGRPDSRTIASLRAFAQSADFEDATAGTYVRTLLAGARDTWKVVLAVHPEFRTAGMVRRLLAETDRALDTAPADAVELTALATDIADHLEDAGDSISRLRGIAWRDHAYALFYTGQFVEAERAVNIADRHFGECLVDEYDRARLGVVKALVFRTFERFTEATAIAEASKQTFLRHGDLSRFASAQMAEAHLLFSAREFEKAAELLTAVEAKLQHSADAATHARVCGNLAYCYWNLGQPDVALQYHDATAAMLEALDVRTEAARQRWLTASMLAKAGRIDEAERRLRAVREDFVALDMTSEAALVSLDVADLLLARGLFDEVEDVCRSAMRLFENAGVNHTARALTALAFIREAAANRKATPQMVRHVRDFIQRLPHSERLLFVPPPELS
jgi:tetratricopeptide (TPR) repeat protein